MSTCREISAYVHFACLSDGCDSRPGPPAAIGDSEQAILSCNCLGPDGAFDNIRVDISQAVIGALAPHHNFELSFSIGLLAPNFTTSNIRAMPALNARPTGGSIHFAIIELIIVVPITTDIVTYL